METVLQAHSANEPPYYLMVTACDACGKGPWSVEPPGSSPGPGDTSADPAEATGQPPPAGRQRTVVARCAHCGARRTFCFRWDRDLPAEGDQAETINPTPEPSRLIDLGQWVALYWHLMDQADRAGSPVEARRLARQARMCLDEALKFHGREELPPESAFFTPTSLAAYHQRPDNYARQRLRELQVRLPAPIRPPAASSPDPPRRRPWWRFW